MTIEQDFQLAFQHHQAGRLAEAEVLYRQILTRQPNHADGLHLLGLIACQSGRPDAGVDFFRRSVAVKPDFPDAWGNLGTALRETGQPEQAIAACRRAIALRPDYPEAHNNLSNALRDVGQLDEAIAACRRAIALRPGYVGAYYNLGSGLQDKGRPNEAIAAYRQAIALRPGYAEAHNNLGNALRDIGRLDEAIAAYRQAIALNPDYANAHSNLGNALKDNGQLDEAIAVLTQVVELKPDLAEAHFNLAVSLLAKSDFQKGWDEYEWRSQCSVTPFLGISRPRWNGERLEGKTLLLQAEQGFGDTLQFIRYLPLVARLGGTIVIECQGALQRLLRSNAGGRAVVAQGDALPHFDLHCPLMSLPRVFGTTPDNIPHTVPYLQADVDNAGSWQRLLAGHSGALKVGLAWAGSRSHKNDRNRSIDLARLAPLARVPGVRLFSLQVGDAAAEVRRAGLDLVDWTGQLKDFADTAGLVGNLDLIVTVDTSVAHLGGAMGKPVWLMLPRVADWRWMLDREDSPWYPTMRLFRQKAAGEWDKVIERVANCLSSEVA